MPFEYPARDTHTGLYVPEPGCFTFDGEHALAYVRSRHYQYFVDGKWKEDPASDLGRVSRQQDFLRRVLSSALAKGFDPGFARNMIDAVQDYVVVDSQLTISRMLEFAGILTDFEPGEIATYQIESYNDTISGNAVLVPRIKGDNMQAILAIFKGEAPLAGAPDAGVRHHHQQHRGGRHRGAHHRGRPRGERVRHRATRRRLLRQGQRRRRRRAVAITMLNTTRLATNTIACTTSTADVGTRSSVDRKNE